MIRSFTFPNCKRRFAAILAGSVLLAGGGCSVVVDKKLDSPSNNNADRDGGGADASGPRITSYTNEAEETNPTEVISGETLTVCLAEFGSEVEATFSQATGSPVTLGPFQVAADCFDVAVPLGLPAVDTTLTVTDTSDPQIEDSVTFGLRRYLLAAGLSAGLLAFVVDDATGPFTPHQIFLHEENDRVPTGVRINRHAKWAHISSTKISPDETDLTVLYLPTLIQSELGLNVTAVLQAAPHPDEPLVYIPCDPGPGTAQICRFDHPGLPDSTVLSMTNERNGNTMPGYLQLSPSGSVLAAVGPRGSLLFYDRIWVADNLAALSADPVSDTCSATPSDVTMNEGGFPTFLHGSDDYFIVPGTDDATNQPNLYIVDVAGRCAAATHPMTSQPIVGRRNPSADLFVFEFSWRPGEPNELNMLDLTAGADQGVFKTVVLPQLGSDSGIYVSARWLDEDLVLAHTTFEGLAADPSDVWIIDFSQPTPDIVTHFIEPASVLQAKLNPTNPSVIYLATWASLMACEMDFATGWSDCATLQPAPVFDISIQP